MKPFLYEISTVKLFPYCAPDGHVRFYGDSVWHLVWHLYLGNEMSFGDCLELSPLLPKHQTLTLFADGLAGNPLAPECSAWSSYQSQCPDVFPVYHHLTHLDLLTRLSPLRQIDWLASLPNLTHLFILSEEYQ